jgi:hypothetical protein
MVMTACEEPADHLVSLPVPDETARGGLE